MLGKYAGSMSEFEKHISISYSMIFVRSLILACFIGAGIGGLRWLKMSSTSTLTPGICFLIATFASGVPLTLGYTMAKKYHYFFYTHYQWLLTYLVLFSWFLYSECNDFVLRHTYVSIQAFEPFWVGAAFFIVSGILIFWTAHTSVSKKQLT